jgi:hypothetical protein
MEAQDAGSFVQQGLQKVLAGKTKKPTSMIDEDWEDLDARALVPFVCVWKMKCCLTSLREETTIGLWNRLESLYMTKSLMNIIFLKRQLYSLRMKEGTKIVDHLNVFNTLICQLSSMDVTYEDEDKSVTLLCSLSESWDHLVTSMWFSSTYMPLIMTLLWELCCLRR